MTKKLTRLIFLGLLLVLSQKSFALACMKDGTVPHDAIMIQDSIAVPNTVPKDTVLWRSPGYSISMTCWQDQYFPNSESVYFYLSPYDQGMAGLGPDLEVGIGLNGVDLRCSQLPKCRVELPISFSGCSSSSGCKGQAKTFPLNFNYFVSKRSAPGPGKEGSLTGQPVYHVFQLDGVQGINPNPDKNFRMTVVGLNTLRYIACSSTLSIAPKTVDFGTIGSGGAQVGKTISELPFSITASKSCNSAYGLGALLKPVNATVTAGNALVPNDNKSVSITLLKQEDSSVLPFGK